MPRLNKRTTQLRKQAVVAHSYIHSSNPFEAASSTWASTLASTTSPVSPTLSTIDLNTIPEGTDVNPPIEPAEDDLPSIHDQESINNTSPDSDGSYPGYGSDDTIHGMEGAELRESLELQMEEEITFLRDQGRPSVLEVLVRDVGVAEWKQAESNWSLGYNKQSLRKKQLDKQAKKAEEENQKLRARWVLNLDNDKASYLLWSSASANLMWSFVTIKPNQLTSPLSASGNIGQCAGWMHTEVGRMLKMCEEVQLKEIQLTLAGYRGLGQKFN